MKLASRRSELLSSAIVGVLAGFLSGLFGVGGGILIVPGLVLLMRMEQRLAHGTSLAAIVPIAVAGVIGYALSHSVDWTAGGLLIVGASAGAFLGTKALRTVPQRALRLAFAVFLLLTAVRLFVTIPRPSGRGAITVGLAAALVALGVVSGVLAGLLGVGGGIVIVPSLVLLFGVSDAMAKGTSLLVILPTALVGSFNNIRHRNADLRVAAVVGLFGTASAFLGSHLALHMSQRLSSVLFATLLVAVALRLFLTDRRERFEERVDDIEV